MQSKPASRTDAAGRVVTVTEHPILTPSDIGAKAGDRVQWAGRTLVVDGATIPKGTPDVIWQTRCVETV